MHLIFAPLYNEIIPHLPFWFLYFYTNYIFYYIFFGFLACGSSLFMLRFPRQYVSSLFVQFSLLGRMRHKVSVEICLLTDRFRSIIHQNYMPTKIIHRNVIFLNWKPKITEMFQSGVKTYMTAKVKFLFVTCGVFEGMDAKKIEDIMLDFMAFCRFLFGQKSPYWSGNSQIHRNSSPLPASIYPPASFLSQPSFQSLIFCPITLTMWTNQHLDFQTGI